MHTQKRSTDVHALHTKPAIIQDAVVYASFPRAAAAAARFCRSDATCMNTASGARNAGRQIRRQLANSANGSPGHASFSGPGTDVITVTTVLPRIARPIAFQAAATRGDTRPVATSHVMTGAVAPTSTSQLRPCHVTCRLQTAGYGQHEALPITTGVTTGANIRTQCGAPAAVY